MAEAKEKATEQAKVEEKPNYIFIKSRANYLIEVLEGNTHKFINPFGKVKVDKNKLKLLNQADATYLTFIKA